MPEGKLQKVGELNACIFNVVADTELVDVAQKLPVCCQPYQLL